MIVVKDQKYSNTAQQPAISRKKNIPLPTNSSSFSKRPASSIQKKPLNKDLRIPLLLVDIGIGDRKERIAVYDGDRADTLAKDFCIRHGTVSNIKFKLLS